MMKPKSAPSSDDVPPSLNLTVDEAKKHLKFLQGLHTLGVSMRPITNNMMERYINKWLPLLADHQNGAADTKTKTSSSIMMIPPPDVAWLWHCHRLAPGTETL